MNLLIIGAGGHGKVVREVAEATGEYSRIDFVDDNSSVAIGKMSASEKLRVTYEAAVVAIGNNPDRRSIQEGLVRLGYSVPVIIHPTAYISPSACLGVGTVVEPRALLNTTARIGEGCIISVGSIVDRDAMIGDYVHINAGVVVEAMASVEPKIKLEANSLVLPSDKDIELFKVNNQ